MYRGGEIDLVDCIKYARWNTYHIYLDEDTLKKNDIIIYSNIPFIISVFGSGLSVSIKKPFILGPFSKRKKTMTRKRYESNITYDDREIYMKDVTKQASSYNILDVSVRFKVDEVYWIEGTVKVESKGMLRWERAYNILDKIFDCLRVDVDDSIYNNPYIKTIRDKIYCVNLRDIRDAEFWPIPAHCYCKLHDNNAFRFSFYIKDIVGSEFYDYELIEDDTGSDLYIAKRKVSSIRIAKPIGFGAYIELVYYPPYRFNISKDLPEVIRQASKLFNFFKIRTDSTDPDYFYDPDEDKDDDEFTGMDGVRYKWDREKNDPYRIQYVATMKAQEIMKQDLES